MARMNYDQARDYADANGMTRDARGYLVTVGCEGVGSQRMAEINDAAAAIQGKLDADYQEIELVLQAIRNGQTIRLCRRTCTVSVSRDDSAANLNGRSQAYCLEFAGRREYGSLNDILDMLQDGAGGWERV